MQKLTISLGPNVKVELESPDLQQLIKNAAFWSELPQACPLCRATVVFFYRNPKDNDYFGLHCIGPIPHETNFGQFKEAAKGFYYKGSSSWKESVVKWDMEVREESPAASIAPPVSMGSAAQAVTPAPAPAPAPAPRPADTPAAPPAPTPAPVYTAPDDDIPF